jgi:CRP-like cAMP-binding protein
LNSKNKFSDYITPYLQLNIEEFDIIFNSLTPKEYQKGDIVVNQGKVCTHQYFILKGLFVAYETDDKGNEHVIQIGAEDSWIGDMASFTNHTKSTRLIKAVENSELLLLSREKYHQLLDTIPSFEKLFRIIFQNAYIKQTERVSMMLNSNAENRFKIFKETSGHLLHRVEWKIIASYLDMSPETLSRIKNKRS